VWPYRRKSYILFWRDCFRKLFNYRKIKRTVYFVYLENNLLLVITFPQYRNILLSSVLYVACSSVLPTENNFSHSSVHSYQIAFYFIAIELLTGFFFLMKTNHSLWRTKWLFTYNADLGLQNVISRIFLVVSRIIDIETGNPRLEFVCSVTKHKKNKNSNLLSGLVSWSWMRFV
jgi:hypothetical protein